MARGRNAVGAIVAQFSQAIGSFLLQWLAYRYAGTEGLGRFSLLYGVVVLATAVITGLVGDPLTVLDRGLPAVRAGLQRWLMIVVLAVAVTFTLGSVSTGTLGTGAAVLFGVMGGVFVAEDTMRRLLMASLRFGGLVVIDLTSVVVSIGYVVAVHAIDGRAPISTFLIGLLLGQGLALAVGVFVLPGDERWLARGAPSDMRSVWRYGSWRSLQQMLRPAMMAIVRSAIVAIVGLAAFGSLESARVYVAPAMLMVGGAASYLFASYARERSGPIAPLMRRADRAVVVLSGASLAAGIAATVLAGPIGDLVLQDGDELSRLAVLGWTAYAAASAGVTPYGSLAAVRGHQRTVLFVRAGESVVSVLAALALLGVDADIELVPWALAVVAAASGAVLRLRVLPRSPDVLDGADAVGAVGVSGPDGPDGAVAGFST